MLLIRIFKTTPFATTVSFWSLLFGTVADNPHFLNLTQAQTRDYNETLMPCGFLMSELLLRD